MNKLKEVTEKICELLRNTEFEANMCGEVGGDCNPIREAEVLMALDKMGTQADTVFAMDSDGEFLKDRWCECDYVGTGTTWHLGKPLHEQSKETIEFLHEILMR
jgi:hypothetical protein